MKRHFGFAVVYKNYYNSVDERLEYEAMSEAASAGFDWDSREEAIKAAKDDIAGRFQTGDISAYDEVFIYIVDARPEKLAVAISVNVEATAIEVPAEPSPETPLS